MSDGNIGDLTVQLVDTIQCETTLSAMFTPINETVNGLGSNPSSTVCIAQVLSSLAVYNRGGMRN